jgi:hypothetical protein
MRFSTEWLFRLPQVATEFLKTPVLRKAGAGVIALVAIIAIWLLWQLKDVLILFGSFTIALFGFAYARELWPADTATRKRWTHQRRLGQRYPSYALRTFVPASLFLIGLRIVESFFTGKFYFATIWQFVPFLAIGLVANYWWLKKGISEDADDLPPSEKARPAKVREVTIDV